MVSTMPRSAVRSMGSLIERAVRGINGDIPCARRPGRRGRPYMASRGMKT